MGWGAAIGGISSAVGSLFGSDESSKAAKEAAQAQVQSAQIAANTENQAYTRAQNALQPYMDLGSSAASSLGSQLSSLTSATPVPTMTQSDLEATPGYQFTLNQGLKATQNSAAARGLGVSGAAMKGAASYATGLSDSTYNERFGQAQMQFQDAQSNQTNAFQKLLGTTQIGQGAAGALAGQSISTGQNVANTQMASGNAQAAGINSAGQSTAAGIVGAGNAFSNALNQYIAGSARGMYGGTGTSGNPGPVQNAFYGMASGNALNGGF